LDENNLIPLMEGMICAKREAIVDDDICIGFELILELEEREVGRDRHFLFVYFDSNILKRLVIHEN
jgi:hypothetical protein